VSECPYCDELGCEGDPTDSCKECDDLWHHYRTGDRNEMCELRHVHKAHQRAETVEKERDGYKLAAETQVEAVILAAERREAAEKERDEAMAALGIAERQLSRWLTSLDYGGRIPPGQTAFGQDYRQTEEAVAEARRVLARAEGD
jgi:hypothetical protein